MTIDDATGRALCVDCSEPMVDGGSCPIAKLLPLFDPSSDPVSRIPYGDPREGGAIGYSHVCHDCGAGPGRYHHFGCDVEQCPTCLGQVISCGHRFEPLVEEEEEDVDRRDG